MSIELPRLPVIDLSLFDIGDPWRDHVAAQIDSAASTHGVFQILDHGVDVGLIDTLVELGGKYVNRVPLDGRAIPDLPGFHDTVREYSTAMTGLGHKLMAAMARGLRLDDGFFADHYTGNPATALRVGGYPVVLAPPQGRPYIKDAADRALLTIVLPAGAILPAGAVKPAGTGGTLLCYVEPMLERLTHGHYVAAPARLRAGDASGRPSLAFVFAPGPEAVLAPLAAMRPRPSAAPELPAIVSSVVDSARLR